MRRLFALIPLLAAVGLIVALGWPLIEGRNPQELPSVLLDKPVPAFDLPALEPGEPGLASGDLAGKPVLVNVFASWCAPCRAEIPRLQGLAEEGVTIYGLAYKDDPEATQRFLEVLGNPYARIGVDRDGRTGLEFGVYGVPETYVIDADGVIRHRHVGEVTDRVADATLVPLLKELAQ